MAMIISNYVHEMEQRKGGTGMFDTSKLRGKIIEKYGSQKNFASAAGCSVTFVSLYLNGKTVLDQKAIDRWACLLDITDEIDTYFFRKKVHEMELA